MHELRVYQETMRCLRLGASSSGLAERGRWGVPNPRRLWSDKLPSRPAKGYGLRGVAVQSTY